MFTIGKVFLQSAPFGLCGFEKDRVDIFYKGKNGKVWDACFDGSWKHKCISKSLTMSAPIAITGFQKYRIDVFYKGPDATL